MTVAPPPANVELGPEWLMGYCEHCDHWTQFHKDDRGDGCEKCHGLFSSRIGYQVTTVRTFNPKLQRKKVTKKESGA